jgi:2,3-bisphosphoglycerate-dependent phosphoglycerate mutase
VADDKITGVEIPTGNPLRIDLGEGLAPQAARYLDAHRAEALPGAPSSRSDPILQTERAQT